MSRWLVLLPLLAGCATLQRGAAVALPPALQAGKAAAATAGPVAGLGAALVVFLLAAWQAGRKPAVPTP